MGIDLSPQTLAGGVDGGHGFEGTANSWIKCARCTEKLKRVYPVETMEIEGAESGQLSSSRYKMIVAVECHGAKMRCALEIPTWWGESMRLQALAYVYAFVRKGPLYTCEVRRGRKGQSAGALATEVR